MSDGSWVNYASSILMILSCDPDRFSEFYDGSITTADFVRDAKRVISHNRELLRKANQDRYRLDELLLGMLDDAPNPSGTRYVAVILHIANDKGSDAVIEAAKAWLDYLYFPMLTLSKATKTVPSGSQTPTYDDMAVEIGNATRSDQAGLRAAVAVHEQYRCAITNYVDLARVTYLVSRGRGNEVVPDTELPQVQMEVAHIIPFSLNKFHESKDLDTVYTWDMLRAWAGVDVRQLVDSKVNSPENGVYMNDADHYKFGRFLFYFEKCPDLPNKYKVQMARPGYRLGNGKVTADVEFLENEGVLPPSPQFLNIHAAFAKVLARSETAVYMERVEMDNQRGTPTSPNEGNDFATLLRSKLLASAP